MKESINIRKSIPICDVRNQKNFTRNDFIIREKKVKSKMQKKNKDQKIRYVVSDLRIIKTK